MRNYSFILAGILSTVLAVCCGKSPQPEESGKESVRLSFSTAEVPFTHEGGTASLELTAPGEWAIELEENSWCTVSPKSGTGNGKVTVTVDPIPETSDTRSVAMMLSCNGQTAQASVLQTCSPNAFIVTPTSIEIGSGERDFQISVKSLSKKYEVTIVSDWIKMVFRKGNPKTGETIGFRAQKNIVTDDAAPRSGIVSICTEDGVCVPVTINQKGRFAVPNVLALRFTATWCQWCPYLDETFRKASAQNEEFLYVAMHGSGSTLYFSDSGILSNLYGVEGIPTGILGGWKEIENDTNTDKAAENLLAAVEEFQTTFRRTALVENVGLTVSGNKITANATITSSTTEDMKVVALLLESSIVAQQQYGASVVPDFVHNNVARKTLTSSITGGAVSFEAGVSQTFSWECTKAADWKTDNLSVLVYVLKNYGASSGLKANSSYPDYYFANAAIGGLK